MTAAKQSTIQLLGVRGVQIGIALFVLQQFAGINAVMYFSTQVFKEVSLPCSHTGHPFVMHGRTYQQWFRSLVQVSSKNTVIMRSCLELCDM